MYDPLGRQVGTRLTRGLDIERAKLFDCLGLFLRAIVRAHRAAGLAGALLLGLIAAYHLTQPVTKLIERMVPLPARRMDVLVFPSQPNGQFRSYLTALALALASVALFAGLAWLVRRSQRLSIALSAATLMVAWVAAFATVPFFGRVALTMTLPLAALLLPAAETSPGSDQPTAPWLLDVWALAGETVTLAWGTWISVQAHGSGFRTSAAVVVGALTVARIALVVRAPARDTALRREAAAGLPLLLLPLIGIMRAPTPISVVVAVVAYAVLRVADARSPRALLSRLPRALPAAAAVWAITAMYSIPHKFRELPRINHNSHEAGNYAWINSLYHGKLFMADTATIYGPLRQLVLAVYVALTGKTAEQVRLGQILIHLAFLAVMVLVIWVIARRRLWALGLGMFLLITTTMALTWLDALRLLAFGWSDLGRMALPLLALLGALVWARRGRSLAAWGAVAGASALYAQETGPTVIVAICIALVVDSWLRPTEPAIVARARRSGARVGSFLVGVGIVWAVFVAIYALFGRAKLLLSTVGMSVTLFASGSLAGVPFPVNERTFTSWAALTAGAPRDGHMLEYVLPVPVYLVTGALLVATAFARRWSARATLMLGLLAFGVATFRVAMARSDYYHVITATAPAAVLLVALMVDAAEALAGLAPPRLAHLARPLAAFALLAPLLYHARELTGSVRAFGPRTAAMLDGRELPSAGRPYSYSEIPRAGDIFMPPETIALTRAIQTRSGPADKVFIHASFQEYAELYFLADRVNPTRYDMIAEIVTLAVQEELHQELLRDPPVLDVGADMGMFNQATVAYLRAGWKEVERIGRVPVSVRVAPPSH